MAVFRVPDAVDDAVAAGVNCALSQMMMAFERADVRLGDRVVIQGAGGLGLYATALARESGASQVVVVDGVAGRLELARQMGADEVVDFTEFGSPAACAKHVRALTAAWPRRWVSSPETQDRCRRSAAAPPSSWRTSTTRSRRRSRAVSSEPAWRWRLDDPTRPEPLTRPHPLDWH